MRIFLRCLLLVLPLLTAACGLQPDAPSGRLENFGAPPRGQTSGNGGS